MTSDGRVWSGRSPMSPMKPKKLLGSTARKVWTFAILSWEDEERAAEQRGWQHATASSLSTTGFVHGVSKRTSKTTAFAL